VKAAFIEDGGAVEVREVEPPQPGENERVIDVEAAGVNFLEVLVRRGRYPQPPELPWIPGIEVSGTVDGERVLGLIRQSGGGYAEQAAVDDFWLFPLPAERSFAEGAGFLMAFLTAWLPLTRQTSVTHGKRLLVTAAAGGVGSAAVQLGRVLGAQVVAAVGSEAKRTVPRSLGADEVVTYDELDAVAPVDVVLDPVGGELFERCLKLLRPLGTMLAVGFAGGAWQRLDPALLVGRNVGVQGFYLGRLMALEPEVVRIAALDLLGMWNASAIHPVVGARFPLQQAEAALDLVESRQSTGKVVVIP